MGVAVPRALLLVLALLHATGLAEEIRRQVCSAECRDEGCDGDCTPGDAPTCPCHCPVTPSIAPPATVAVELAAPTQTQTASITFDRTERAHASPDPREILHVPRRAV